MIKCFINKYMNYDDVYVLLDQPFHGNNRIYEILRYTFQLLRFGYVSHVEFVLLYTFMFTIYD